MTWEQWASIIALVLALAALVIGAIVLRKIRVKGAQVPALAGGPDDDGPDPSAEPGPPAFVVNPIKVANADRLRQLAITACSELRLPEPLWYETTVDDPGLGQAKKALAEGASVVIAAGGDGTVRAVATALANQPVPMGLVPMGTGNLLAHNVDLPSEGDRALIHTALTGVDRKVDVGWIRPSRLLPVSEETVAEAEREVDGDGTDPDSEHEPVGAVDGEPQDALAKRDEHLFLVMGGLGFDAAMVAGADDELKAKVGYFAYFLAGARHLHGRKIRLHLQVGDAAAQQLRLRTLLFANCGRLPGGIVLLPDAEINDGLLDVAAIDTRGGVLGWASLFGKVIAQGVGIRRDLPASPASITFWRGREFQVQCEEPEPVQVDGDLIGEASSLSVRIEPGALMVRVRS